MGALQKCSSIWKIKKMGMGRGPLNVWVQSWVQSWENEFKVKSGGNQRELSGGIALGVGAGVGAGVGPGPTTDCGWGLGSGSGGGSPSIVNHHHGQKA